MMVPNVFGYALYLILLYLVFSLTEWTVHRYFMHGQGTGLSNDHWTHHKDVQDDMTLKTPNRTEFLGLYFLWSYSLAVFTVGLLEAFVLRSVLASVSPVSAVFVVASTAGFALYQASFWNTIHPDIHGIDKTLSWQDGVPGSDLWKRAFGAIPWGETNVYDCLKKNHVMHHKRKLEKKGNYNVTLPGADWLFRTYYTDVS
jgi:hypothetical protein